MIEILNGIFETVAYQELSSIRLYLNSDDEDYPIHWHTAPEIIMPIESTYSVRIDDTLYTLREGDIMIISSGELHSLYAPKAGKRIILQYELSLLSHLKGFDSTLPLLHPAVIVTPENTPEFYDALKELLLKIQREYFSNDPFKEPLIYASLIEFYVHLGRKYINATTKFPNIRRNKHHEYIEKFLRICNYINEHCTENLTLEDLAKTAGFSKFHFSRLFKQFTNLTYNDYLNKCRVMYAEMQLTKPNISITEVAMQSGFNTLSTFNRVFKSIKNCTPTEFRYLYGAQGKEMKESKGELL